MHKNDDLLTTLGMVDDSIEYSAVFKGDSLGISLESKGGVAGLAVAPEWPDKQEHDCAVQPAAGDQ